IAATHRDLPAMVKQGTFREDLYYRLKVFPIQVPALRQRTEDIPRLVRHFIALYAQRMNKRVDVIPPDTMDALVRYPWPGNIRELQNFIERAVILSPHSILRAPVSELDSFQNRKALNAPINGLAEVERDYILHTLEASNWVIGGRNVAAERLGMKRTSLVYRMKKLRISRPQAVPHKRSAVTAGAECFPRRTVSQRRHGQRKSVSGGNPSAIRQPVLEIFRIPFLPTSNARMICMECSIPKRVLFLWHPSCVLNQRSEENAS